DGLQRIEWFCRTNPTCARRTRSACHPIGHLGARGAIRRVASRRDFRRGLGAETKLYRDTTSFRRHRTRRKDQARRRGGLHHGLLALLMASTLPSTAAGYEFDDAEQAQRFTYLATPISLQGRIVDEHGLPLLGAQLRLIGWGEGLINDGEAATSWFSGSFTMPDLARRNVLLEVSLAGY